MTGAAGYTDFFSFGSTHADSSVFICLYTPAPGLSASVQLLRIIPSHHFPINRVENGIAFTFGQGCLWLCKAQRRADSTVADGWSGFAPAV